MPDRSIVVDANILIRAVLGKRVRLVLETHADDVSFFVPETAYAEAEEHLAALILSRGADPGKALQVLQAITALGTIVNEDVYRDFEHEAKQRLGTRDPEDWPILAAALALACPVWTEDTDFFGCGVATWTSATITVFLTN